MMQNVRSAGKITRKDYYIHLMVFLSLLMLITLMAPMTARAQSATYAIVNNPNPNDRLNIRDSVPGNGSLGFSMGKYYNGAEVEVLSYMPDNKWVFGRIGNMYGYMQKDYLAFYPASDHVEPAFPIVQVNNPKTTDRLNLRDYTSDKAKSLGKYTNGTKVYVLGVLNDGWYHVRVDGLMGYMMAKYLTALDGDAPENNGNPSIYTKAVVNNPNPKDRLNLRESVPANGTATGLSIGKYYNGVEVETLPYPYNNNWLSVRIGNISGFMQKQYLTFQSTGNVQSAIPIVKVNNPKASDRLNLRETASDKAKSLGKYSNGTWVEVLGVMSNGWYHVRVDGQMGFMMAKYLTSLDGSSEKNDGGNVGVIAVVNNPNPKDRLNLRESIPPDGSATGYSLGKYYNGVKVEVVSYLSDKKGWVFVRIGNMYGFMQEKYLAFPPASNSVKSAIPYKTVNNPKPADRLNLRETASEYAKSLGKYSNGTQVEVLGIMIRGWYHVRVDGVMGYMMGKYLE